MRTNARDLTGRIREQQLKQKAQLEALQRRDETEARAAKEAAAARNRASKDVPVDFQEMKAAQRGGLLVQEAPPNPTDAAYRVVGAYRSQSGTDHMSEDLITACEDLAVALGK